MSRALPAALLTILLTSGCGGEAPPAEGSATVGTGDPRSIEYAPALGIDFSEMRMLPSGLWIKDDLVGTGAEAAATAPVTVHYTGFFSDGTIFDSSRPQNQPFRVTLGQGNVIPGWDQGIPGMRVGGRRVLVIPPQLGYGEQGYPGAIPPNAVLVFQVELLATE